MRLISSPLPTTQPAGRDISIDYLRAFATVLVLVIHCSAPYTHIAQTMRPASWQSPVPIIDTSVSYGLDYILMYLDASAMSLMFFISGMFVYQGLRKQGVACFLRDRLLRLGLPFVGMALCIMPVAYYVSWSMTHPGGTLAGFWLTSAHLRFPAGPGWFLWLLFFFDCAVGLLYLVAGGLLAKAALRLRSLRQAPALFALCMVVAGVFFYLPLALRYSGIWLAVLTPPFMVQPSRALYYAAWFFAGVLVGSAGLKEGLLARDGSLARSPLLWGVLGLIAGNALWFGTYSSWLLRLSPLKLGVTLSLLWVLADTGICLALLALFRGKVYMRRGWADSLAKHAYAIYAFHYIFALGIERLLLPAPLPPWPKFLIALAVTLALSWLTAILWLRLWNTAAALARRFAGPSSLAAHTAGPASHRARTDSAA